MKVCHITHGRVNPDGDNGVTRTVYNLNKYLNSEGAISQIYSFNDKQVEVEDFERDEHTKIKLFPRARTFGKSAFSETVRSSDFEFDIVHFHLMWMTDKNSVLKILSRKHIPYVITTHGAYAPGLIGSFKKKASLKSLEGQYLKGAKAIHALCFEEKQMLRDIGVCSPIHVLPNGLGYEEVKRIDALRGSHSPYDNTKTNIAWVGRIRSDKNLEGLINALSSLDKGVLNNICLNFVGEGSSDYEAHLKALVASRGLTSHVIFHGSKFGEEKYRYVLNCDIYAQVSHSEGLSFSILDAMGCSRPMILSRQTNMTYYYNRNFYRMVEPDPVHIAEAIQYLVDRPEKQRELGRNARELIMEELNWKKLVPRYISMYSTVLEAE